MEHQFNSFIGYSAKEHRLCNFAAPVGPDTAPENKDVFGKRSGFLGRVIDIAKALPQEHQDDNALQHMYAEWREWKDFTPDLNPLLDDAKWRAAWMDPYVFEGAQAMETIKDPRSFLLNLEPKERLNLLIEYVRERLPFVSNVVGDSPLDPAVAKRTKSFNIVYNADPDVLAANPTVRDEFMAHVRNLMFQDATTHDAQDAADIATRLNPGLTGATAAELTDDSKAEVQRRYANTETLFLDFRRMLAKHPEIAPAVSADRSALFSALRFEDGILIYALRNNIVGDAQLALLTERYQKMRHEEHSVGAASQKNRMDLRAKVDEHEHRKLSEKLMDNWSNLEGWQKVTGGLAGLWYAHRLFVGKKRTPFEQHILRPFVAAAGFYVLGGRQMLEGTAVDKGMKAVWDGLGIHNAWDALTDHVDEFSGHRDPAFDEKSIETYARFFNEVATEKVTKEIEAITYLSNLSLGDIANSFTFTNGARGGSFNLDRTSPITLAIQKIYGPKNIDRKVMQRLKDNNAMLGDGVAHLFFELGSDKERGNTRAKIEAARGSKKYDELTGDARKEYQRLAEYGLSIARSPASSQRNFLEIIDSFSS